MVNNWLHRFRRVKAAVCDHVAAVFTEWNAIRASLVAVLTDLAIVYIAADRLAAVHSDKIAALALVRALFEAHSLRDTALEKPLAV